MSPDYPLTLDVTDRRVLVVGGGPVAARRATSLLRAGADVHVVAPALCEDLADLAFAGQVTWAPRDYEPGDIDASWLVHTATGERRVNRLGHWEAWP